MDNTMFQASVLPKLQEARGFIRDLSSRLNGSNVVVLAESRGISDEAVYGLHQVTRRLPKERALVLVVESSQGSVGAASTIADLCRDQFGGFTVVLPFLAKGPAALLFLAANERMLTRAAQIGPAEPQFLHPDKSRWFPSYAIRKAVEGAEATSDMAVKRAMADQLDPFLVGASESAIAAAHRHVTDTVESWDMDHASEVIAAFTTPGDRRYSIDRQTLDDLEVPYTVLDSTPDNIVSDLHGAYSRVLTEQEDVLIIMSTGEYYFSSADFKSNGPLEPLRARRGRVLHSKTEHAEQAITVQATNGAATNGAAA